MDLQAESCTCPHFKFRGAICKHIHAVQEHDGFKVLTVETIPTILADISKSIQESVEKLCKEKRETLIYTDDPPEKDFHYELIY